MPDKRTVRLWTYSLIGLGGGIALLSLSFLVFGRPLTNGLLNPASIAQVVVSSILAVSWAIAFATLAYRNADEFMQEGSRVSWYWGGLMGVAASAPVYVFVMLGGLHWLWPSSPIGKELARAFAFGYALPVVFQLLGFTIVAAWWQLSKAMIRLP